MLRFGIKIALFDNSKAFGFSLFSNFFFVPKLLQEQVIEEPDLSLYGSKPLHSTTFFSSKLLNEQHDYTSQIRTNVALITDNLPNRKTH